MEFEFLSTAFAIAGLVAGIFCGWVLHQFTAGRQQKHLQIRLRAQAQSYAELRERFDAMLLAQTQRGRKEEAARDHLLFASRRIDELQDELAKLRSVCAPRKRPLMDPRGEAAPAG